MDNSAPNKKLFILTAVIAALFLAAPAVQAAPKGNYRGHNWDEVTFTSSAMAGMEEVKVHAKLVKGGRPMFELLEITVGKDRIEIPDELSRQIDYPNLRSFLLMSQVKDNTSTIWLTVEPQWKGKNPPKYTFEITEGELKWMGKDIDGKTEVLFKQ